MKPKILYLLALSLSLIIISCKKSEMITNPPSTNGVSIKLYKSYYQNNRADDLIDKFNVNMVSSIKLNDLPSLNLLTYYKDLSFHPVTVSNKTYNVQVFFIIKDNITNEIKSNNVFLDDYYDYNFYGIRRNTANDDSSLFNATVYAFLVKDMMPAMTDTINFEIDHDGVKEIIPIIPNKNTLDLYASLVINKNTIDTHDCTYLKYKLLCNDNEKVGIIWNYSTSNNQPYWAIKYFNSVVSYPYAYSITLQDQLKFYAFKLIY